MCVVKTYQFVRRIERTWNLSWALRNKTVFFVHFSSSKLPDNADLLFAVYLLLCLTLLFVTIVLLSHSKHIAWHSITFLLSFCVPFPSGADWPLCINFDGIYTHIQRHDQCNEKRKKAHKHTYRIQMPNGAKNNIFGKKNVRKQRKK